MSKQITSFHRCGIILWVSSGFSRPDPTLRRERNDLEQPFGFPSSMRVHVPRLTSKRQITSLFLLLKETLGTLRYNDATATRTSKNNNRFNKQTCTTLFCTFRYRFCTTTTWKCLISLFMENINKQWPNFISFLSLDMLPKNSTPVWFAYIWQSKCLAIIAIKTKKQQTHSAHALRQQL